VDVLLQDSNDKEKSLDKINTDIQELRVRFVYNLLTGSVSILLI